MDPTADGGAGDPVQENAVMLVLNTKLCITEEEDTGWVYLIFSKKDPEIRTLPVMVW